MVLDCTRLQYLISEVKFKQKLKRDSHTLWTSTYYIKLKQWYSQPLISTFLMWEKRALGTSASPRSDRSDIAVGLLCSLIFWPWERNTPKWKNIYQDFRYTGSFCRQVISSHVCLIEIWTFFSSLRAKRISTVYVIAFQYCRIMFKNWK